MALCPRLPSPQITLKIAALTMGALLSIASSTAEEKEALKLGQLSPRGTRRVIYTSDLSNTTSLMSERATADELRAIVRNYASEGAIDTVVQEIWHQGWSTFWRSKHCEYDSRPQHQRLVPMMDSGTIPMEVYLDECHKQNMEFLAGFRMNDRHGHNPDLFEKIGREHPDWVLGFKPTSGSADPRSRAVGCSLNYAQAGVRDWLFSIMEEVANRYDVDGLEFNFTRMPEVFRSDVAAANHPIMTKFMRRVRTMLDEAGERKGRKLLLGVRVPQNIEGCRKLGLDVPTWIRDKSINYVVPADIGFTDFNARYEEFVELGREHECYVYPQLEYRLSYPRRREPPQTLAHSRAAVRNFFAAGADGFSTQNFANHWGPELRDYPQSFNQLKKLRDPKRLAEGDRHYVITPLWGASGAGSRGASDTYQPEVIELSREPAQLGKRATMRFRMCENLKEEAALTFKPWITRSDEIAVDINGTKIPAEDIRFEWPEEPNQPPVAHFPLTSPPAVYGDNQFGLRLIKSDPNADTPVLMYEVEVVVKGSESR